MADPRHIARTLSLAFLVLAGLYAAAVAVRTLVRLDDVPRSCRDRVARSLRASPWICGGATSAAVTLLAWGLAQG